MRSRQHDGSSVSGAGVAGPTPGLSSGRTSLSPERLGQTRACPHDDPAPKNALRREPSMASTLPGLGPHLEPSLSRTLLRPRGVSSLLGPQCLEDGVLTASCTQACWWTQASAHAGGHPPWLLSGAGGHRGLSACGRPPSLALLWSWWTQRPQRVRAATLPGLSLALPPVLRHSHQLCAGG